MGGQTHCIIYTYTGMISLVWVILSLYAMLMESHHVPVAIRFLVAVCLIAGYCSGK